MVIKRLWRFVQANAKGTLFAMLVLMLILAHIFSVRLAGLLLGLTFVGISVQQATQFCKALQSRRTCWVWDERLFIVIFSVLMFIVGFLCFASDDYIRKIWGRGEVIINAWVYGADRMFFGLCVMVASGILGVSALMDALCSWSGFADCSGLGEEPEGEVSFPADEAAQKLSVDRMDVSERWGFLCRRFLVKRHGEMIAVLMISKLVNRSRLVFLKGVGSGTSVEYMIANDGVVGPDNTIVAAAKVSIVPRLKVLLEYEGTLYELVCMSFMNPVFAVLQEGCSVGRVKIRGWLALSATADISESIPMVVRVILISYALLEAV